MTPSPDLSAKGGRHEIPGSSNEKSGDGVSEKFYLTTPLYYVNSKPHIGHAYTEIASDVLARWHRMNGREVLFLTGTDEHGQKVDKAAKEAGLSPQEFTDKISLTFRELWKTLGIEYDDFIRTTEPRHKEAVAAVWRKLSKSGDVYRDNYSGWYCTPDETFWTDGQILRENGTTLCPDCKRPVEHLEEENFFFKISKYQRWLTETVREGKLFRILPESRKNEVLGFLDNNTLQDLCISRPKNRLSWGIPSPLSDQHVTYVWFDALINYISAVGFGADEAKLKKWWPADAQLIGKDILRHHAVIWPILLHALGLAPPRLVFAHGWWVQGGQKMSKSRGNVTDPAEIVKTYGVDAFRYFLLREAAFGSDGTFSEDALTLRYNTDLANDLGNLLNRTLTMCEKYFEGAVPAKVPGSDLLAAAAEALPQKLREPMNRLAYSEALSEIWAVVSQANKYIEEKAPWALSKQGKKEELAAVIGTLVRVLGLVAMVLAPFMPQTAKAMMAQLGTGGQIAKGPPLFPRIETDKPGTNK